MEHQFTSDKVKRANLLLLGPSAAGKSSFLNSVASICKGRVSCEALSGNGDVNLTTKYGKFAPKTGTMKNFCLLDSMGLDPKDGEGLNVHDVLYMVKGHVPIDYKFNPRWPITEDGPSFKRQPKEKNKVHCIIYVVDAEEVCDGTIQTMKKKILQIQSHMDKLGMNRVMIITKVDKLCEKVYEDISNVHRSKKVKEMVAEASELFHIPPNLIFPVQNYYSETILDYKLNIPILFALRKMLNFAEDYLEGQVAVSSDED